MRPTLLMLVVASLVGGCCVKRPTTQPSAYYGPTDDLPTVVDRLNSRSERVVSLRAEGSFSADLVDPKTGKHDGGDGDVTLLFSPPQNLRLSAKVLLQTVFDIGSNDTKYWMLLPRQDQIFVGTHVAAGQGRAGGLPIQPEALIEVLGVTPLPTDLLRPPAPALRFNNAADCYMVTFNVRLPDRWAVQKEVWYDRQTLVPTRVFLYDADGRAVLDATPSDPRPVAGYDPPLLMPWRYDLIFPETGSTFGLRFSALERSRNGAPNDKSFRFPANANVSKVEDLDR